MLSVITDIWHVVATATMHARPKASTMHITRLFVPKRSSTGRQGTGTDDAGVELLRPFVELLFEPFDFTFHGIEFHLEPVALLWLFLVKTLELVEFLLVLLDQPCICFPLLWWRMMRVIDVEVNKRCWSDGRYSSRSIIFTNIDQ